MYVNIIYEYKLGLSVSRNVRLFEAMQVYSRISHIWT